MEVLTSLKKAVDVSDQVHIAVDRVILFATGVDKNRAAGKLQEGCRALTHVDEMSDHGIRPHIKRSR